MTQVPLESFSGLVASLRPSDLPDGASPRTFDTDFITGRVVQRPGQNNVYTFSGASIGPNPAFSAVDTSTGNAVWSNPTNILFNDGNFATATVNLAPTSQTLAAVSSSASSGWTNPNLAVNTGTTNFASANRSFGPLGALVCGFSGFSIPASAIITGVQVSFQYGGASIPAQVSAELVIGGNTSGMIFGAASATWPTTGGLDEGLWGFSSITPAQINAGFQVNLFYGVFNPVGATLQVNSVSVTVFYNGPGTSDDLDVTQFTFAVPGTQSITGVQVAIKGMSSAAQTCNVQLLAGGVALDPSKTFTLPASNTVTTLGGANDQWQASLSPSLVNETVFGARIWVTGVGTASLDYITIELFLTPGVNNFNFVGSFQTETGVDFNLALDAAGGWWLENITNNPRTLTEVLSGTTANSYGSGTTVYDRAFVANSTLTGPLITGSDVPRQYNLAGGWWDRITQVGPGAPPQFAASQASGAVANITAISTSGGVATVTAANSYTAGEVGTFGGITGALNALNGQTLIVLSTGLSSSQFEVATAVTGTYSGSGATFTPQYVYPISSITQPAAYSDPSDAGHLSVMLWSAGPGSTSTGNTITVYYQSSFNFPTPDTTLVNAFNSGFPVFVYITGAPFGNGIWQVTSIGNALPPQVSHWRYYFTIQVPTSSYQISIEPAGQYQITQGTVTTASPVPGLAPGAQVSISGASVAAWDGVYPIVQSLNSGAMNITQTALSGGTATYTWSLVSGVAPAAGQLVTVTNTLNANGILNVAEAVIVTATGTTSGTFTINGFASSLSFPTTVEEGQATTAGTKFIIDPGAANAGSTSVNPIFGNSTGGSLTVVGIASSGTLPIGAGTRQGICYFITRNGGGYTASPPVTFTVAQDANYLTATQIPIGPPNVIARGIALTEAGQNGIPGANFYTSTVPTIFTVGGVQYTSSSFLIPDNVTTTAKFTFSDAVLLQSDAIDVPGSNWFNLIEIGNPAWILQYADRTFSGGCQNKIQNFNNLSFDGGYIQPTGGGPKLPLGWTVDPNYNFSSDAAVVQLNPSPVFGNSLYIKNTTGSTQSILGMITQSAYQDAYNEPILIANTPYSVRVTCRIPSGIQQNAALVLDLVSSNGGIYGQSYGSFTLPLSQMTTQMVTYTGSIVAAQTTIPVGLLLRVYLTNVPVNADLEIDRIEVFPTNQPVLSNQVWVSYASLPEQVDFQTGQITLASQSQDQVMGAAILHDTLHFLKENSIIECEDAPNYEPSQWTTREVSQRVGTCGPNAFDYGDEWLLTLHQTGIYCYNGGVPMPFRELQGFPTGDSLWDQINWSVAQTFWLANDLRARRFYVGVAMNTPNFWLPNAPEADPTQPNVILMCNYDGCATFNELEGAAPVHVTMFGNLKAMDMRRKWSIWQIASPFGATVLDGQQSFETLYLGNGRGTNKIYRLLAADIQMTDDGVPIAPLYTTNGQPGSMTDSMQKQIGAGQKYADSAMANIQGSGKLQIKHYHNTLNDQYPYTVPFVPLLSATPQNNLEWKVKQRFQRLYTEYSMNQTGTPQAGYFELSEQMIEIIPHAWGTFRGVSQ